jgi:protoporphyrinogen oxidase
MDQYDIIIIGAGISGLSLAHYCADAGMSTLVIEKSTRTGGCFHSHHFDGNAAGFWLELGAHTCYNSYGNLIGIMERNRLMESILKREKVPFRMLVDAEIKSITSQLSFPELLTSAWRLFALNKEGESVASYYSRIVGKRNFERVFAPAFNAVISQRADDFPANMLFNKRPRRKDIIKSFTLTGGLQTITDRIAARPEIQVVTGMNISAVTHEGNQYLLTTTGGKSFAARNLALATPPTESSSLARGIAPELSGLLGGIRVETIETVGVAISKERINLEPLAGIIARDDSFYSAVSRDTVTSNSHRGFSFHFKAGKLDEEAKLSRIAEVLKVKREDLQQVATRISQLPSPVVGHGRITAGIDQLLAGKRLLVVGNYFAGMAVEDCIGRSRSEFERLLTLR